MNVVKYDPFRDMRILQNEINRLFSGTSATGNGRELSFENNVLTLKGERRFERKTDDDNYHRIERSYGAFSRSFTLPQAVTAEGAKAEYANGMLSVTLAKREETKARKIEVIDGDALPQNAAPSENSLAAGA